MALHLYNTLTRRQEPFHPARPPHVTFYSCGPTVYDYAHIGNFRSFLAADLLRRFLEFSGYSVRHVMNITDVGHMVDDSSADGGGEDKMAAAQRRLKEAKKAGALPEGAALNPDDPYAVADFYANAFIDDARTLGMKVIADADAEPSLLPRPTRYVPQMVRLVEELIRRNHAYIADDGVVYFDVQSFPDYGRLSGNTLDQLQAGAGGRVDEADQAKKKHPADFMLWKPDPTHLMRWPSPWGEGYPGWHLECSAMAMELLAGETGGEIDLHSGGEDNIFPHHECEIAQSRCANDAPRFARHWFHPRHLFVEGEKMSKSKGNFYTVRDVLARGFEPAALRLELIKTHYRSNANFTTQGLKDSQRMVRRWRAFVEQGLAASGGSGGDAARAAALADFTTAMDDDLNVARALGVLNAWIGSVESANAADAELMQRFDTVLGVLSLPAQPATDEADDDAERIESLIAERNAARKSRNFARADEIRNALAEQGVILTDSPTGTTWAREAR